MNPFIVCFNGPPRCGKDTAARALAPYGFVYERFSRPLYGAVSELLGITEHELLELKDKPVDLEYRSFFGDCMAPTGRDLLIDLSEHFTKPRLGQEFFGRALVRRIEARMSEDGVSRFAIADSGFTSEIRPLLRKFGEQNIAVVRVHRPGRTFEHDSRDWVNDVPRSFDIHNDGSMRDFENAVVGLVTSLLDGV